MGGHDIVKSSAYTARSWQCRCCHRTATNRAALAYSRCPGSAVRRWARAAAAAATSEMSSGSGHCLLLTGTVAWCWKCGASACVQARRLALPCVGRLRGSLVQARQRLLLGLHPSSRVRLNAVTVPEVGQVLPLGFAKAVEEAEISGTRAASPSHCHAPASETVRGSLMVTARLVSLRARIQAKEALAQRRCLRAAISPKRTRLRGKQPDPRAAQRVSSAGPSSSCLPPGHESFGDFCARGF